MVRRAIFFALLTWLPIMLWALLNDRLFYTGTGEPLLRHFGIHVRCLVAIPLFILSEALAAGVWRDIVGHFRKSNIIGDGQQAAFSSMQSDMARLRDHSLPWIAVIGLTIVWTLRTPVGLLTEEMSWAAMGSDYGFGGLWFLYVAKPIFVVLLLGWIWRIALVMLLFLRITKLDLSLTPSHPDQCGGLGFLKKVPKSFVLLTLAISSIIASRWMHEVVYHDQTLASLKLPFAAFVILWLAIVLSPVLLFTPRIAAMKREALLTYGALVGNHGRLVHQRWILGRTVSGTSDVGDLLDTPELGPVADVATIYHAVRNIQPVAIDKSSIMMVLVPILVPMMVVITHEIPLKDLLLKLVRTVV